MNFVHLHVHSHYSLLDGLAKIDDLVSAAKKHKMPALALTDHGNMYGAIEFYKKCRKAGIKPIIGVEFYTAFESRHDKRPNIDNKRYHLVLLAKNETGYKNLIKLVTISNLEGYYYKPRIDKEVLRRHADGLIGLSACLSGEISRAIMNNKTAEKAEKLANEYREILGKDNFYLEIMHHPKIKEYPKVNKEIINISKKTGIPLVATHDTHYINPEDADAHNTLVAVQTNSSLSNNERLSIKTEDFSFISPQKADEYFIDTPEAIENTLKIADKCHLELELGKWVFPEIITEKNNTPEEELTRLANLKLEEFIKQNPAEKLEAKTRLEYELSIINKKGYAPYFLIVADIINFARQNNIYTNTRGSAAGSLASFLVGITNVNPIKYKLPFERFLNPDRPSPPDIDMDFADDKRDEVLDYVRAKYGKDKVAQIGTFGTMMARGAVRDVARALGHPYGIGDRISKLIPLGVQGFPMTIDRAMEMTPELKTAYESEEETKKIIDLARKIEGCARHISVHAAGVVIAPTNLTNFVPLQFEPKGEKIITQYDMHSVEAAGLLKFDFLGIRNLSILGNSVDLVKKFHNIDINIEKIPLDDPKTFKLLSHGETMGLFQLGGGGMTRWLKELKPTTIHDINAMVALFRPGPMENIPEYIRRKHNKDLIKYIDPKLKNILSQSYGVITYQDDVLLTAINLAGYTWTEADKLRKAMGKKIPKEMSAQKEKLLKGFVNNGMTPDNADKMWRLIEPFAAYGFNKAHAASYGKVAYQTAYMKANFPAIYMTAVLTAESGDTEKIAEIINECKRMGINVLPPDINESFGDFTVIKSSTDHLESRSPSALGDRDSKSDQIRFGLHTIKNLGAEIANAIIDERKRNGKFASFSDFLERVKHKNLNKKSLESLVKSGAMDSLEERGKLLANLEEALEYSKEMIKESKQDQSSLFGLIKEKSSLPSFVLKKTGSVQLEKKLLWEKELLGLYISGHPLDKFKNAFDRHKMKIKDIYSLRRDSPALAVGMIENIKKILTKKGDPMMFLGLMDMDDKIEVVIFPKTLETYGHLLKEENVIKIKGSVSERNGTISIIADKISELKK